MNQQVQEFARAARQARDMAALRLALSQAGRALGFDHILLQGADGTAWLAAMPAAWQAPDEDAVLAAAAQCFAPFLWSDVARLVAMTPAQHEALSRGLGPAVTVPVHRPRGPDAAGSYSRFAGCCSFVMQEGGALPFASLAAAHYVGALAFDAAEALLTRAPSGPRLTPRQRECVMLAAQGKSDQEIGRALGISESTVHKHIEDAKRRFGVGTRVQLVVRALYESV